MRLACKGVSFLGRGFLSLARVVVALDFVWVDLWLIVAVWLCICVVCWFGEPVGQDGVVVEGEPLGASFSPAKWADFHDHLLLGVYQD